MRSDGKRIVVRHIDGDPTNNQAQNLRYGTDFDNTIDRVRHGYVMPDHTVPVFLSESDIADLERVRDCDPSGTLGRLIAQYNHTAAKLSKTDWGS